MQTERTTRSSVLIPDKEIQGTIPVMELTLRAVCRRLRARLVGRSGTDTPVQLGSVRTSGFSEFLDEPDMEEAGVWTPFQMERSENLALLVVQNQLLSRIIGRMFGEGEGDWGEVELHPLTEVELSIGRRLCENTLQILSEHWPTQPAPHIHMLDAGASRHVLGDSVTPTPAICAEIQFGRPENPLGWMRLILPGSCLRGLAVRRPAPPPDLMPRMPNFDRVMGVEMDVVVELSKIRLPVRALERLKIGDMVPLGPAAEARAVINNVPVFHGQAGAQGGVRSVRMTRRSIQN